MEEIIAEALTGEEQIIFDALLQSREIQEYIWQELSLSKKPFIENQATWIDVFQKRVYKIAQIDASHPSYKVELRKRILQQAALSICALKVLDK